MTSGMYKDEMEVKRHIFINFGTWHYIDSQSTSGTDYFIKRQRTRTVH
jgi:hypothetical protein